MARTKTTTHTVKEDKGTWKSRDPWTMVRKSTIVQLQTKVNKTAARDLAKVAELMNNWVRAENSAYQRKQCRYAAWVTAAQNVAAEQQDNINDLVIANRELAQQLDGERTSHNHTRQQLNILADLVIRIQGANFMTPEERDIVNMYKSTPVIDSSSSDTESEFEVDYEELLMAINPRQ